MKLLWEKLFSFLSSEKLKIYSGIILREKYIILLFFVSLALCWPIVFVGEKIVEPIVKKITDQKIEQIKGYIEIEKRNALSQAEDMVALQVFDEHIKDENILRLVTLTEEEASRRNLTFIVTVNSYGMALSRVPVIANRGDYVFQTLPWGQAVSRGEKMATIGSGRSFPLVIVGASPIMKEGTVEGAIFAGYWFNDEYAKAFKQKYLSPDVQLVFYSTEEGVVGGTIENGDKSLINVYINSGTNFIQKDQSNYPVRIGEKYFFAKNIFFENEAGAKIGGAVVFLPTSAVNLGIVFSTVFLIIFLCAMCILHKKSGHAIHYHPNYMLLLLCITILILFFGTMIIFVYSLQEKAFVLKEPSFTIYNSILKLEPEWGVFDISTEQNIAIKIISGGESINTVKATIEYDSTMVKVVDIVTSNSFCNPSFFIEKNIDSENGLVEIACTSPGGIEERTGILAELLIVPINPGEFSLRFGEESQVLAHDGLGTNVLRQVNNASFRTLSFSDNYDPASLSSHLLFSTSHPNSERWYNNREVVINWPKSSSHLRHAHILDQNPFTEINQGDLMDGNILYLNVPKDGIYYVHVAREESEKFGPTAHLKIKVDNTPPALPDLKVSNRSPKVGEVVRMRISSKDGLSGLQNTFYYQINDSILLPLGRELAIPFQEKGTYTITARAFDNAGNFSDSSVDIKVED